MCTERVIRMRSQQIPPTLVGIQAISLILCLSAFSISGKRVCHFESIFIRSKLKPTVCPRSVDKQLSIIKHRKKNGGLDFEATVVEGPKINTYTSSTQSYNKMRVLLFYAQNILCLTNTFFGLFDATHRKSIMNKL